MAAELTKEQTAELACTYAALILHDDNVQITASKMSTLIKAAGVSVPAYYPGLFERVFASRNIDDLLAGASSGPVGAAPAAAAAAPAAGEAGKAPAKDEGAKKDDKKKKDDEEDSEEVDMGGFGLFGEEEGY
eukprot:TRINITY_DN137_c0_g1_i1.p1 TRINITY_DN137_c0_g1~~TRINITY_DN137_c0_g1_i1.p1  ORF type:complete len:132 (+),score=42.89 TRINITY_DN137_c0_g1_i1:141-536(+)